MSVEMESLSSILSESAQSQGDATSVAEITAPPAVEPTADTPEPKPVDSTRDEAGRFAARPEEKPALTKADVAAIMDERRKRQELERELTQLRSQQPQKAKTDIFDNPDVAINERLQERLAPLEQTILNLQVELAKSKMPDFDDVAKVFFTHAQNDAVLMHQANTAPDEFAFIYREGKRLMELGDVGGDIMKYRDKVTAEAKLEISKRDEQIAQLTAQLNAATKAQAELDAVPRSLNNLNSSAPKSTEVDPDDLKSLVRFKSG